METSSRTKHSRGLNYCFVISRNCEMERKCDIVWVHVTFLHKDTLQPTAGHSLSQYAKEQMLCNFLFSAETIASAHFLTQPSTSDLWQRKYIRASLSSTDPSGYTRGLLRLGWKHSCTAACKQHHHCKPALQILEYRFVISAAYIIIMTVQLVLRVHWPLSLCAWLLGVFYFQSQTRYI